MSRVAAIGECRVELWVNWRMVELTHERSGSWVVWKVDVFTFAWTVGWVD